MESSKGPDLCGKLVLVPEVAAAILGNTGIGGRGIEVLAFARLGLARVFVSGRAAAMGVEHVPGSAYGSGLVEFSLCYTACVEAPAATTESALVDVGRVRR
jgi:hypothetical protein